MIVQSSRRYIRNVQKGQVSVRQIEDICPGEMHKYDSNALHFSRIANNGSKWQRIPMGGAALTPLIIRNMQQKSLAQTVLTAKHIDRKLLSTPFELSDTEMIYEFFRSQESKIGQ